MQAIVAVWVRLTLRHPSCQITRRCKGKSNRVAVRRGAGTRSYHYEPSLNCIPNIGKFPISTRQKNRGWGGWGMFDFTDMGEPICQWSVYPVEEGRGVRRKQTEGCSMLLEPEIQGDHLNSTSRVTFPLDGHSTPRSLMSGLRLSPLYHTNISFGFSLVLWQRSPEHSDCNGAGLKS